LQSADLGWRQVAATQAYTAGKPNWYREWRLPTNFEATWAAMRITDCDADGRADMMLRDSVTGTIVRSLRMSSVVISRGRSWQPVIG
jgi:hypothetical protein